MQFFLFGLATWLPVLGLFAGTNLVIKVIQFCVSRTKNLLSGAWRNRVSAAQVPLA